MFFYKEDEVTPKLSRKIESLIGRQIPFREQLRKGTVGSGLYHIRKLTILTDEADIADLSARCTFEKFEKGLLLRINDRQKLYSIAIPYDSIDHFELIKGEEHIEPLLFSPMWILLKLGVHIRFARYFIVKLFEYSIDPLVLKIQSGQDYIELDGNGYNYYGELKYFKQMIEKC